MNTLEAQFVSDLVRALPWIGPDLHTLKELLSESVQEYLDALLKEVSGDLSKSQDNKNMQNIFVQVLKDLSDKKDLSIIDFTEFFSFLSTVGQKVIVEHVISTRMKDSDPVFMVFIFEQYVKTVKHYFDGDSVSMAATAIILGKDVQSFEELRDLLEILDPALVKPDSLWSFVAGFIGTPLFDEGVKNLGTEGRTLGKQTVTNWVDGTTSEDFERISRHKSFADEIIAATKSINKPVEGEPNTLIRGFYHLPGARIDPEVRKALISLHLKKQVQ